MLIMQFDGLVCLIGTFNYRSGISRCLCQHTAHVHTVAKVRTMATVQAVDNQWTMCHFTGSVYLDEVNLLERFNCCMLDTWTHMQSPNYVIAEVYQLGHTTS
jgi:hypothetical protein